MARLRIRRRNKSTGALLVNPRKRRTNRRRRTTRRRNLLTVRTNRRTRRRRTVRRRRNLLTIKRNPRRRRRASTRRRNYSRRRRATSRRRVYRRRRRVAAAPLANPRRRRNRRYSRRRNPRRSRRRNPGSALRKIPLVGGFLAEMFGFIPYAALGALGVEPTMWASTLIAPYAPMMPASLLYAGTGAIVAALVAKFAPVAPATRQKLALAIASAAGGVAYYKWRTGQDAPAAGEMGLLEMKLRGFGDGGAYNVVPMGNAQGSLGLGAVVYGT